MSRLVSTLYVTCALICTCRPGAGAEEITLERALSVLQTASPEQLEVRVAESRVHLLESLSKRRFDLRPQLGILTLTNPVAMAASIGSGLLVNRNAAPSPYTVLDARVDLLTAELQNAKSGFSRRLQTSRTFVDLIDVQRAETQACNERDAHDRDRSVVEKLVARGRLTMVDQLRYEQEHMQLVSECLESQVRRKLASAALAMALGKPRIDLTARLTDVGADLIDGTTIDQEDAVLESGEDQVAGLRRKAAQIRRAAAAGSRNVFPDVAVYQSHASETGITGNLSPNYLAGANFVYPTISWRIPLRNTGEHEADVELLNAKLQKFIAELDLFEQMIRGELQTLHAMNANAPERIAIEEQKLTIAERSAKMVSLRYDKGLAAITDVLYAQQQERRFRVSTERMRAEAAGRKLLALAATGRLGQTAGLPVVAQSAQPPRITGTATALPTADMQKPVMREVALSSGPQTSVRSDASTPEPNTRVQPARSEHRVTHTNDGRPPAAGADSGQSGSFVCGIVNGRVGNCVASSNQNGRRL